MNMLDPYKREREFEFELYQKRKIEQDKRLTPDQLPTSKSEHEEKFIFLGFIIGFILGGTLGGVAGYFLHWHIITIFFSVLGGVIVGGLIGALIVKLIKKLHFKNNTGIPSQKNQ